MKKLLITALLIALSCTIAHGAEIIGVLSKPNSTESQFEAVTLRDEAQFRNFKLAEVLAKDIKPGGGSIRYYDNLTLMQMALNKGEIDSIGVPIFVGEYMLKHSDTYNIRGFIMLKTPIAFSLGLLESNSELRDRISTAIQAMEADGTIGLIGRDFITGPNAANPPAVKIEHFDGAETIKVAVTGDMPPLDYIAPDGTPSGFSAAILAEIGRRLHVNISLINIESSARVSALASGRADVTFWFMLYGKDLPAFDIPDGVIVSTPYFGTDKIMLIGKK